jgi:hypothetical protein
MPIIKNHDPMIDLGIIEYVGKGWSAKQIMEKLKLKRTTFFNYMSDLGLKIQSKQPVNNGKETPTDPNSPPGDKTKEEPNPEEQIKENITKKHVKDVSEKLATLTVEHELEMRKIVVALEKHAAIFESIEEMGLTKEKFIDVCIEIGYDAAKEAYMKKVREAEEREAMKQYLEMRAKINGSE